jgi:hypothetical protein
MERKGIEWINKIIIQKNSVPRKHTSSQKILKMRYGWISVPHFAWKRNHICMDRKIGYGCKRSQLEFQSVHPCGKFSLACTGLEHLTFNELGIRTTRH